MSCPLLIAALRTPLSASRYSTTLHLQEQSHRPRSRPQKAQLTPLQGGLTLFAASIPVNVAFIAFVKLAGWTQLDRQLLCTFVVAYQGTVSRNTVRSRAF
jgi:hypothetical protein